MAWNNHRRRGVAKEPTPPRAFMGYSEERVKKAIKTLAQEQRFMASRHISVEDFRQLFIPEPYRHSLKEAFGVAAQENLDQVIEVNMLPWEDTRLVGDQKLTASFRWDHDECPEGFFALRNWKHELQPDVPAELMEKWQYVQQLVGQASYEWGMVQHVFDRLNTNGYCNTPQQMRLAG